MGFDPSEISNPKKTAHRRMTEADAGAAPAAPSPGGTPTSVKTMSQSEFTSGGPTVRKRDEAKRNQKFIELMRKHTAN
jgi:hypothetical protein